MFYDADFATADAANAPLDAPLMIGADPVLWGALLLGLAAAVLIGWYLGQGSRGSRIDAAVSIWDEIDEAAKEAMKADGDTLSAKASALRRTIDRRLGKTLGIAAGAGRMIKALDAALGGEGEEPHKLEGGHRHGDTAEHRARHEHDETPSSVGGVTVIVNADAGRKGGDGPGDHETKKGSLGVQERNDALRLAIGRFNDHWRLRADRLRELRAAHAELSTGPRRPAGAKVSGTRAGH